MNAKLAVQLYTLRESCEKDFIKTLEEVAKVGYEGVEFAGFYDVSAQELKRHLNTMGLTALSSHTAMNQLENEIEEVIKYNQIIGNSQIVCPYTKWGSKDEYEAIIKILKSAALRLKEVGMSLFYHNHSHEFSKVDGAYNLDRLFSDMSDVGLLMELDTYWVEFAGLDPVQYMEENKSRCKLVHLKDMTIENEKKIPCALGTGTMPIKDIMNKATEIGIEWYIVENDFPKNSGIEDITVSMSYLKSNKG